MRKYRLRFETFPQSLPLRTSRPDIPEDVYLSIFEHIIRPRRIHCGSYQCAIHSSREEMIEYRHSLCNLTLVCRFFAVVFMPKLLRSMPITLVTPSSVKTWIQDRLNRRTLGDFARGLLRNNNRTCAQILRVKECTLISNRTEHHDITPKTVDYLVQVTGKLPHTLECLFIRDAVVTNKFFATLGALTNLTSLAFSHVTFSPRLVFPQNVNLRLESFSLFDITTSSRTIVMASLSDFICSDTNKNLHALYTDDEIFFEAFMTHSCAPYLEELELDLFESQFTFNLLFHLGQMRSLKTLSITPWFFHSRTTATVTWDMSSPVSLPELQHLHCPAFMASSLVPGRPLKVIDLYYFQDRYVDTPLEHISHIPTKHGLALFHLIQRSTAFVEVLRIPAHVYLASSHLFTDAFPRLNELCLRFPEIRYDSIMTSDTFAVNITMICDDPLPITHLGIVFGTVLSECQWSVNLALQAKMITLLHSTFPALRYISFATSYDKGWIWRLQGRSDHSGDRLWKPSIGRGSQMTIREALKKRPTWYPSPDMDFDRTFATLFSPSKSKLLSRWRSPT